MGSNLNSGSIWKKKIYSTKDFAKALGISKNHLLKLEAEGKVPSAKRVQRGKIDHRYYEVEDIAKYRKILGMPPLIQERKVQLFFNFKGGTGKSTLSASYAYAIAEMGIRVLAIDLDAQQHLTKCLGFDPESERKSIFEVLIDGEDINKVISHTEIPTLDIIPGNLKLSIIENRLPNKDMREFLLTSALGRINCEDYKVIVIDSLPNITILNKNAILAANDLLIPVLPDYLSYDGLGLLFSELARMEESFSIYTERRGGLLDSIRIIINQYRANEIMSRQTKAALEKYYPEYMAATIVPYNAKVAQATAKGQPIFQYDRRCKAALQIRALVHEILGLPSGD